MITNDPTNFKRDFNIILKFKFNIILFYKTACKIKIIYIYKHIFKLSKYLLSNVKFLTNSVELR
jgi:hypothetical protein